MWRADKTAVMNFGFIKFLMICWPPDGLPVSHYQLQSKLPFTNSIPHY